MDKYLYSFILFIAISFLSSCATSMSPRTLHSTLPDMTSSKYLTPSQAEDFIHTGKCKYLVKDRSYTAPIGLTVHNDLRSGARGIDEWVDIDGGNAYVLTNYNWVTVDHLGSTQLKLQFNTMTCDF